jgi:hypothetical protein
LPHRTQIHLLRSTTAIFAIVLLAASLGGCGNGYPRDWPPVSTPWFASCPDLRGTYRIGDIHEHDALSSWEVGAPFVRRKPDRIEDQWESMTIAGNAAEQLTVRFERSARFEAGLERLRAGSHGLLALFGLPTSDR